MPKREVTYPVARSGWATAFSETELPPRYALQVKNRFINIIGRAEKRQGIVQEGNAVPSTPTITGIHELVQKDGTAVLFVSGDGKIFKYDDASAYTQVHAFNDTSARIRSIQFDARLIFYNGVDRNIFTEDGTTFRDLVALIEQGTATGNSNTTTLEDSDVGNWVTGTDVAVNDIVFNEAVSAYGVITAVGTAAITHTPISTSAAGIGVAVSAQTTGQSYKIIDAVELNIIPIGTTFDNTAVLTSGSSPTEVRVSGVDFTSSEARAGDWIYNSTKVSLTRITGVSANLGHVSVSGQAAGDSVIFLKSAMPITSKAHVHYGRAYYLDARDKRKIRISGVNDPQDLTTDAGTLDSVTFSFGGLQPIGDIIKDMSSFQNTFVLAGKQNIYVYSGVDPISTSGAASFAPTGLFPQGVRSADSLISLGNDMAFITSDGLQAFSVIDDRSNLKRANLSEAIRPTLRAAVDSSTEEEILCVHYPQRSWLIVKVGTELYIYNYSIFLGDDNKNVGGGSWSLFDGPFAQQRAYFVRADGSLWCAGAAGRVFRFDTGTYSDDGRNISTVYQTGWLTLGEPKSTIQKKQGKYITPFFDAPDTNYTIRAEAPYAADSTDTIMVASSAAGVAIGNAVIGNAQVGGSSVQNPKYPLRWMGEVARFTFTTNDSNGPDVLSKFTLEANIYGRK
jgi:hypothetical protein